MEYRVSWEIDIEANSPREAAQQALEIQRRKGSSAVVFTVTDEKGEATNVDLDADTEEFDCRTCGEPIVNGQHGNEVCNACFEKQPEQEKD